MKAGLISVWLLSIACVFLLLMPSLRADWLEYGTPVCIAPNDQLQPAVVPDETGGVVVAWTDWRTGALNICAQRMSADGDTLWPANGIALCDTANNKDYAEMVPDGTGGAIIVWTDQRDPATEHDIYAQRVDGSGTRLWSGDGVAVCDTLDEQRYPDIASDGVGGAIIVWQDRRGTYLNIYAQRIDGSGTALWERNGIGIDTTDYNSISPEIVYDGAGGAIFTWEGYGGIRAQRVNANGDTLWSANGVSVCTDAPSQWNPMLVSDGNEGAIITWTDNRTPGEFFIYAQRVDADGDTLWTADGIPLCKVTNNQGLPAIVSDGSGGAIVAWEEGYDNQDIHAQRVDGDGNLLWTADGVDVCTAPNRQVSVRMVADGSGGAIIIWDDERGAYTVGYTQRLDADGNPLWAVNGISIYYNSKLAPDGAGGAYYVWEGWNPETDSDIYISLVDENGQIVPTLLRSYSTDSNDGVILISWSLSSHVSSESFDVHRKDITNLKPWEILPVEIDDRGDSYSFTDATCLPGLGYSYRVHISEEDGRRVLFETGPVSVPGMPLVLYQNYPNPFNPGTRIEFYLPSRGRVWLDVYNVEGKIVRRLLAGSERDRGKVIERWDGTDERGQGVASGIYYCRLRAGKISQTRKMVLLK
jgi:hypothetical protein